MPSLQSTWHHTNAISQILVMLRDAVYQKIRHSGRLFDRHHANEVGASVSATWRIPFSRFFFCHCFRYLIFFVDEFPFISLRVMGMVWVSNFFLVG
ncbi:hypothetical protein RJT34_08449 [Clitoria ternatea]|uniref:Uncharacterized protein n=1 Tax=Clitoria ternatea TaxID=43366 RepID=A0AAN9PSS5_CLITE